MAKIRDIMEFKRKKEKNPICFAEHLKRANDRYHKPPPIKPAEVMSIDQIKRLMGDTGSRQFLKDKGNVRK
ncbi:hypothetical protein [Brevibacillus sp. NRS-1366]|uniref:hypothetical protein n=1 Tax=Brevibacillus sp. NRS-1366 TaxID=3233899 RepID=UPI003D25AB28